MSRPAEPARPGDAGFSMVEVIVAIGLLGILVMATLPSVVGGIKATELARRTTQGKSILLGQTELVRNLPFWVARNAGEFVDVLDRFYTDLTPPASAPQCGVDGAWQALATTTTGYVADGAARCAWEPGGPMYRTVRVGTAADGRAGFVVVTNLQFLNDATPPSPVTPPPGWTTKDSTKDHPPARQVGVTVTVLPTSGTVAKPDQTYTQVSRQQQAVTRIRATVDAAALEVGTSVSADVEVPLTTSVGLLKVTGSTSYASTVDAVLSALSAGVGTGLEARGATTSASAPPTATGAVEELSDGRLDATDCALVCWGGTRTSGLPVSAQGGLPNAGSPTSPLEAWLKQPSDSGRALRFGAGQSAAYRAELAIDGNPLRMKESAVGSATSSSCAVETSGTNVRVAASGWVQSTAATEAAPSGSVESCGTTRTAPIALLPTSRAPDLATGGGGAPYGLLRVQLQRASARCRIGGTPRVATATYDYRAAVEVWNGSAYTLLATITPGGTDRLSAIDPASVTLPEGYGNLGRWIRSWSSLTADGVQRRQTGGVAAVRIPGVVTILTQPLRNKVQGGNVVLDADGKPVVEPASTMSLNLGAVSCHAEDRR